MPQVVEHLPSKQEALSSNLSTTKKKKRLINLNSFLHQIDLGMLDVVLPIMN
jgi:hypothetical protein